MVMTHKIKGKFQLKWERSFVPETVYSNRAYHLITPDGDTLMMPINGWFLKKYYPWCTLLIIYTFDQSIQIQDVLKSAKEELLPSTDRITVDRPMFTPPYMILTLKGQMVKLQFWPCHFSHDQVNTTPLITASRSKKFERASKKSFFLQRIASQSIDAEPTEHH